MKAAIYHEPMKITTEDVPIPTIGDMDILVKVRACGICGSDLHMYRLGVFAEGLCRPSEGGMIPGHEFSGEVVEVGKDVSGLELGDRVTALTFGGMAEYVPVTPAMPGLNVYKLPDEVGWVEAATTEPLGNSLHATQLGSPADGQNIMIFGAGIIGLGIIQSLKLMGIKLKKLIMVDVSDKRLEMAKDLGVDEVINAATEDVYQRAIDLTAEVPVTILGGAMTSPDIDVVYDCVGYIQERPEPPVLQQALMIAKEYGTVVVHGAFEAPVTLEMMPMVAKHIKVLGSYGFVPADAVKALELMRDKKVDRMKIITHEYPIEQAKEAFDIQCQVDNSVKVVIIP
jgi:(R,R)-butanediol dehydrogenase / meso-butanediol dehydrogenase / diacetyl reductase